MSEEPITIVTDYQMRNSEGKGLGRKYFIRSSQIDTYMLEKGLDKSVRIHFEYCDVEGKFVEVGFVTFAPMPGCCGVVISTNLYILPEFRGGVYSSIFQELRAKAAWRLGYTSMLATIQMNNIPQVVSCAKHGWKFLKTFTNRRSGNLLAIVEKGIPDRADWNAHPDD